MTHPEILITERLGSREYEVRRLGRCACCGAAVTNEDGEACFGRPAEDMLGNVCCNATADRLGKDYCCGRVAAANINGREYCGGTLFCSDECFMKYYGYCRAEV